MTGAHYSVRLGTIRDDQLSAALNRFDLGTFVSAAPIQSGLFGQNLFLTSSEGEFVLRGAPHWVNGAPNDRWQFYKERFFAGLVHEHTRVPAPWPQHYDETSDIFGWPYVVMPRLPGICLNDRSIRRTLPDEDQRGVATALGDALFDLQTLHWPTQGDINEDREFASYPAGYARFIAAEIVTMATECATHGAWTIDDDAWIDPILLQAESQPAEQRGTYVHADFKLDNMVVMQTGEHWRVSGIFDFHTACFGDGLADICRQACSWMEPDDTLARAFLQAWLQGKKAASIDRDLLSLYLCSERLKIWSYFSRPGNRAEWLTAPTFSEFIRPYHRAFERILDSL